MTISKIDSKINKLRSLHEKYVRYTSSFVKLKCGKWEDRNKPKLAEKVHIQKLKLLSDIYDICGLNQTFVNSAHAGGLTAKRAYIELYEQGFIKP